MRVAFVWFCQMAASLYSLTIVLTLVGCKPYDSTQLNRSSSSENKAHSQDESEADIQSPIGQRPDEQLGQAATVSATDAANGQLLLAGDEPSLHCQQPIANDDMQRMTSSSHLIELLIDHGIIDDVGMEQLVSKFPRLIHLRARLSPITDHGAKWIAQLKELNNLNLPQSQITAQGIRAWQEMPDLAHVRLGGEQLDDQALAALTELPKLQSLHLIGASLTDDGIMFLVQAKSLSSFYLDDCPISDQAWELLRAKRPDLHIHVDQQHRDRRP